MIDSPDNRSSRWQKDPATALFPRSNTVLFPESAYRITPARHAPAL